MPPRKGKGASAPSDIRNSKIVLTGLVEGADRYLLCKTLASELGIPFEEATGMVTQLPHEIFSAIPEEAAEIFAEKIREAGGNVEVLSLADGLGPFCERHPHRRARAKCKGCGAYICEEEILSAGKRLYCPDCYRDYKAGRRIRVLAVLGIFVGAVALWLVVRPIVQRAIRYSTHDREVRVRVAFLADRADAPRLKAYADLGDPTSRYAGERLSALADLFNAGYRRYTGLDRDFLTLEVTGLHETDPAAPVPTDTGLAFHQFFAKMEEKLGISGGAYAGVLFVYLVRGEDLAGGADIPELVVASGDQAVVRFAADQPDKRAHYLAATAVALGEILGARPKLSPLGNPAFPDGYADPSLGQVTTSRKFEVMAGYRPDAVAGHAPIVSVRDGTIGPRTAWELGWISSRRLKDLTLAAAGK